MLRKAEIHQWVRVLIASFGKVRPAVPAEEFRSLYAKGKYTNMVSLVKNNLRLDMRLKVGYVNSGGPSKAPCWIVRPADMPMYGTSGFRKTIITMYVRKSFLAETTCDTFVAAIAHELSHIVLDSTMHNLRKIEEAVDLTAMLLGYHEFFLRGASYIKTESNQVVSKTHAKGTSLMETIREVLQPRSVIQMNLGYLSKDEYRYASELMHRG